VPIHYIHRSTPRRRLAGIYRSSRIGMVTPLRDGMNLVAKEYIAAQDPQDPGVLVLSRFAGAARQLQSALIINPYDADEMADALDQALTMSLAERKSRWEQAWDALKDSSALGWGRTFVAALLRATAKRPLHAGGGEPATTMYGAENRPSMRLI
jgi:trehalose 6-phosphate synthase